MFEYESFNIPNVIYCFEQYNSPKTWDESSQNEKNSFISLYRKTLKKLLGELKPETIETYIKTFG